jgi:hypothetical protein
MKHIPNKAELIKEYEVNCRRYRWNDPFDFMAGYVCKPYCRCIKFT